MKFRPAVALAYSSFLLHLLILPVAARALLVTSFGPLGIGGDVNGQLFRLGDAGQVHELDLLLRVDGPTAGTALFSDGASQSLFTDWAPRFDASLVGTGSVLLTWEIENRTATSSDLAFLSLFDAEIAEPGNTFFNEHASVEGAASPGQDFEIDEPGFSFGDLYTNFLSGRLDGTNAVPASRPEDVALALSFEISALAPGEIARFELLISESGDALEGLRLVHRDPGNPTVITFSGRASILPIPEPGTAVLLASGLAALAARRRYDP